MKKRKYIFGLILLGFVSVSALPPLPVSNRYNELVRQREELIDSIEAEEEARNEQLLDAVEHQHATPANIEEINDRQDNKIYELRSQLTDIELEMITLSYPTIETNNQMNNLLNGLRQNLNLDSPTRSDNQ